MPRMSPLGRASPGIGRGYASFQDEDPFEDNPNYVDPNVVDPSLNQGGNQNPGGGASAQAPAPTRLPASRPLKSKNFTKSNKGRDSSGGIVPGGGGGFY